MREASHRQGPFAIRGSFPRSLYRNGEDTIQMKEINRWTHVSCRVMNSPEIYIVFILEIR